MTIKTERIREFAERVILDPSLAVKLAPPPAELIDDDREPRELPPAPNRAPELRIETDAKRKRKVPPREGMPDVRQRVRILHGLANHELQAIELFAWALLRFPAAPRAFRRGIVKILAEEQLHCRLYLDRIAALGGRFGDEPLSGYFWSKIESCTTALRFICAMCLTFENANLDHALDLADAAAACGDPETAAVLVKVHDDELGHVRFGWRWLARLKLESQTMTEAYLANLAWPLRPVLARGPDFRRASRERVGLDEEFIGLLEQASRPRALYRIEKFGGPKPSRPGGG